MGEESKALGTMPFTTLFKSILKGQGCAIRYFKPPDYITGTLQASQAVLKGQLMPGAYGALAVVGNRP